MWVPVIDQIGGCRASNLLTAFCQRLDVIVQEVVAHMPALQLDGSTCGPRALFELIYPSKLIRIYNHYSIYGSLHNPRVMLASNTSEDY